MSKRLIPLLLSFLLFSLMGTPVQAMDCEWVSQLKNNSGTEIDVSYEYYLESPILLREEYEQLLKNIASYSVCMDKKIKNILSEMASSETEGTNWAQLILTLEEKLREVKNANENINRQLLQQEQQYDQFREQVAFSDETFKKLIESLELAHATQIRYLEGVDDKLESKLEHTANQIKKLSARLTDTDNKIMELSVRLSDSDNKIDNGLVNINNTLSDKTLYGIISILVVTLFIIFLYLIPT